MTDEAVIWHDLECGRYVADLAFWSALAAQRGAPVLDVGAGTGRVALSLARAGHEVLALECDPALAAELERRAAGLAVRVLLADACDFALPAPVPLVVVPMQTVHLLRDRDAFLRRARAALGTGGTLAVALLGDGVEPFEIELDPDAVELAGVRYESAPTALRREGGAVVIERRRSRIAASGAPRRHDDVVRLRELDAGALAREAGAHRFALEAVHRIAPTGEHAGSEIVLLEATG
jgi:SAM-dependent methyltransferase